MIPGIASWMARKHGIFVTKTQLLTGHGCFRAYITHFELEDESLCPTFSPMDDTIEHVLQLLEFSQREGDRQNPPTGSRNGNGVCSISAEMEH